MEKLMYLNSTEVNQQEDTFIKHLLNTHALKLRSDLLWDNLIKGYVDMLSITGQSALGSLKGLFIDVMTDYNPVLRHLSVGQRVQQLIGQCLHGLKHD